MTKTSTSKYGPQTYTHRGVAIEQTGLAYTIWADFVHLQHAQYRVNSLAVAAMTIDRILA